MSGLVLDLPPGGGPAFDWLLAKTRSGEPAFANDALSIRQGNGDGLALSLSDRPGPLLSVALQPDGPSDRVEVAPGTTVQAAEGSQLVGFLRDQWQAFDHLGINLSHLEIAEAGWRRAIAEIGAAMPAYTLEIGSANDIVMIVVEDAETGRDSVVELVYDRGASRTTFHVCARVAADRVEVDAAFPAPFGAYKPGDGAFFRSVALPVSARLPAYIDLAFSDAQMGPWPQIVAAMGKRIA